jgi:ABC-type enterochelin transport system substrate-binding protein
MKSTLFSSRMILATLVFALATSAFAASDSHKSNFDILAATQVNGTTIPAGEYTAKWEGSGPTVQVSIMQGRKVVATVPAQIVTLDRAASDTRAELKNGSNGERELTGLRFAGKKVSLELGTESAKAEIKASSSN